jgi:hypothetical protein
VEVTARLGDRVRPLSRPARTTGGAFEEVEVVEGVAHGVGEGVRVAVAVAVEVPVAVAVEFAVREGEGSTTKEAVALPISVSAKGALSATICSSSVTGNWL